MMLLLVSSLMVILLTKEVSSTVAKPKILYKQVNNYNHIWNDKGTGVKGNVAFWKAENYERGYCALGDVATRRWETPTVLTLLVKAVDADALAHPTSFTRVWTDQGTGGDANGAVFKMNGPPGYICLGGVAVASYSTQPDKSMYCCVKTQYTVRAELLKVWVDVGSGANAGISIYETVQGLAAFGSARGNFISSTDEYPISNPSTYEEAYLLKTDDVLVKGAWTYAKNYTDKPLKIYETNSVRKIWIDEGSGSNKNAGIFRAETTDDFTYSLGDIAVHEHGLNMGFVAKLADKDDVVSLRNPIGYRQVWNDGGSGANMWCEIYEAMCPGGYRTLGQVATKGGEPAIGDIKCVKDEYLDYGEWKYIWNDLGSGANSPVTFYEAAAVKSYQQSIRSFRAVASHTSGLYPDKRPIVLKDTAFNYYAEKPIAKLRITHIAYQLEHKKKITSPVDMSPVTVENPTDAPKKATIELSTTNETSSTFTFSQSIEIGVSVELSAGIPLITKAKTELSLVLTSTFETGTTETISTTTKVTTTIIAPPWTKASAYIESQKYTTDIPFIATVIKTYYDGTKGQGQITGVFRGVAVNEHTIKHLKPEPLVLVTSTCGFGCATCTSATKCKSCLARYYVTAPVDGTCSACGRGCATCTSATQCGTCLAGYHASSIVVGTCSDINECTLNTDNCHATLATCTNTDGSFTCACIAGYEGDGVTCAGCFAVDTDYWGNDISAEKIIIEGQSNMKSASDCQHKCQAMEGCHYFSYIGEGFRDSAAIGICHYKTSNEKANVATLAGVISGPAICPGCFAVDTDYSGNDITAERNVPSVSVCQHKCQAMEGCQYFSYVGEGFSNSAAIGNCHYKNSNGKANVVAKAGVVSGPATCLGK